MGKYSGRYYGQANPGPTGPTGTVVVNPGKDAPAGKSSGNVQTVDSGSGAMVTGVQHDPSRNRLVISRGGVEDNMAVPTTRYGVVQHAAKHISVPTSIPTIDHWAKFDAEGDVIPEETALLPPDFVHEDGFADSSPWVKNLPEGLCWVRLGVGSEPLGEARWDADVIEVYVEPDEKDDVRKKPTLVRAYILADVLTLVFNIPVTPPPNLYQQQRARFLIRSNKSGKIGLKGVTSGAEGNLVEVTLDREIILDEKLTVQLGEGAVKSKKVPSWAWPNSFSGSNNRPSPKIPVVHRVPKSCYALAMNRAFEGGTLSKGTSVSLNVCTTIRDKEGIEWPVYDATEVSGASAAAYIIGAVVGGNSVDLTPFEEETESKIYSTDTRYVFSLPVQNKKTKAIITEPSLKSWDEIDLGDSFTIGDSMERTPEGLTWVSLERPYTLGTAGWDAALDTNFSGEGEEGEPAYPVTAKTVLGDFGTVLLFWSLPASLRQDTSSPVDYIISLTRNGQTVVPDIGVQELAFDSERSASVLTLTRPIDTKSEVLTISVAAGAVESPGGQNEPPLPSSAGTVVVRYSGDKYTIVPCFNRTSTQGFVQGDLVFIDITPKSLSDEEGVTRTVYDLVAPATSTVPSHMHLNDGGGVSGGGRAALSAFSDRG